MIIYECEIVHVYHRRFKATLNRLISPGRNQCHALYGRRRKKKQQQIFFVGLPENRYLPIFLFIFRINIFTLAHWAKIYHVTFSTRGRCPCMSIVLLCLPCEMFVWFMLCTLYSVHPHTHTHSVHIFRTGMTKWIQFNPHSCIAAPFTLCLLKS